MSESAPLNDASKQPSLNHGALNSLNSMEIETCKKALEDLGGLESLCKELHIDLTTGLTETQVPILRSLMGENKFPENPLESYFSLVLGALSDCTLLILICAGIASLVIGIIQEGPEHGWIEGGAILIAVALVANISAANDYAKQKQFAALEKTTADADTCMVFRDGINQVIPTSQVVFGDVLILQAGNQIAADALMIDDNVITSNQSSLTGEPEDKKKSKNGDCMLYSSCLVSESGDNFKAMAVGIGKSSQWGKIKTTLATEASDTPLQVKLGTMTTNIGYIGMFFALITFISLVISIWTRYEGEGKPTSAYITRNVVSALILSFTVIVVAIPEGLPLAVTIALAYSTSAMYKDQCLIRVLAACETMGNATNICSDKTGTLTENRMTVVAGWFSGKEYTEEDFDTLNSKLPDSVKVCISDNCSINRTAMLVMGPGGITAVGNKTEGALMIMCKNWGFDYENTLRQKFHPPRDKVFSFNSAKKRSSAVVTLPDGTVRVYCKGASEWVIKDCTRFSDEAGNIVPMTEVKRAELSKLIESMAKRALRTLVVGHIDFKSIAEFPAGWEESGPPDAANLICDCIVGIIDPLRSDVKDAVKTAQGAGVIVRMVTGDNIMTAIAIAKQCGIKTDDGTAVEGPVFRKMTPAQADEALKNLQVMARSSPEDKWMLVTRLNGGKIPADQKEWEEYFAKYPEYKWETHKDLLLPGYREEWTKAHVAGEVVGVTGDGTNDAPALKAADVGLSMGITGTKVAQGASDIVILDDKFSSIVRAIMWGRCVYDNIRKFLQFQLTVNIVALLLVFVGAAAGFGQPLTAVQMLWVNLIMDTMGALALGTEKPTLSLLERKPYKRTASLISRPMIRNMLCQAVYQLVILFILLFRGAEWFGVRDIADKPCYQFDVKDAAATVKSSDGSVFTCGDWSAICKGQDGTDCYNANGFSKYQDFISTCLSCAKEDYIHGTIIFNAFIWCQIFNEYTARSIRHDWNIFKGVFSNPAFFMVSVVSAGCQYLIVQFGGRFTSTSPIDWAQWLITVALGFGSIFIGMLMRFIPCEENPNTFFGTPDEDSDTPWYKSMFGYDSEHPFFHWGALHPVASAPADAKKGEVEFTAVAVVEDNKA
jgi:Ca2+-transporting ATPase